MLLIQKNNKNIDFEIYSIKTGDLEKQNELLMLKLQEKNKELIALTEKISPTIITKDDSFYTRKISGNQSNVINFFNNYHI